MLDNKKKYMSWILSALLCFSNSFTVANAEEETPAEEPETQEVTETEQTEEPVEEVSVEEEQPELTEENEDLQELEGSTEEENKDESEVETQIISDDEKTETEQSGEESDVLSGDDSIIDNSYPEETEEDSKDISGLQDDDLMAEEISESELDDDEETELYATNITEAYLTTGLNINYAMKRLAGVEESLNTTENYIAFFQRNSSKPASNIETIDISADGDGSILMWITSGTTYKTIRWYSPANVVYLNPDSSQMFRGLASLNNVNLDVFNSDNLTNMMCMFADSGLSTFNVGNLNTSHVTNMSGLFNFTLVANLDLSSLDTSSVTDFNCMFAGCSNLRSVKFGTMDTSNVTDMHAMFNYCTKLTELDLSGFNTSKVTDFSGMFYNCSSLKKLDLSGFDTSKAEDIREMFYLCSALNDLDISSFNTSKVKYSYADSRIFDSCSNLKRLKIGPYFSLLSGTFPTVPNNDRYNGTWELESNTDEEKRYTSLQMKEDKPYVDEPGTYVWVTKVTEVSYVVNHYIRNETDNKYIQFDSDYLSAINGSTLYVSDLAKYADTYCFEGGYLSGNTTKPTKGRIDSTTIWADSALIINLYYSQVPFVYSENEDGTLTITEYTGSQTDITIPAVINNKSVSAIGTKAFYQNNVVRNVVILDGIINIENSAFSECPNLTGIVIPNTVMNVGKSVFQDCVNLSAVSLSENINKIETKTFSGCAGLSEITIPNNVASIELSAFYGCASLSEVTIPNSVTSIGSSTFYGCTSLTEVTIPNSVTSIGSSAFYGCSSLTVVTIPNSVTSIGSSAFYGCTSLTEIAIPNSIASIEASTFEGCTGLTNIIIPNSVTNISSGAFNGCKRLTEINLPETITYIGSKAYRGCTGLTKVVIPNSVTGIGSEAFYGCTGLLRAVLPKYITSINSYLFYNCTSLKEVTIPSTVTSIDVYAFYNCTALKFVYYGGTQAQWSAISINYNNSGNNAIYTATKQYDECLYGHEYGTPEFVWSESDDGYTVTAIITCTKNQYHKLNATKYAVLTEETDPTCEIDGAKLYSVAFDNELFGVQTKEIILPATGHEYGEPEYIWTLSDNGYNVSANAVCQNDSTHVVQETVSASYEVMKPAVCEENGIGLYTVEFENEHFSTQTKEESIEALGHDYQYSGLVWIGSDEDGYTDVEAEYICSHDDSHRQRAAGTVDAFLTEPTCETDGATVYTGTVTAEASIDGTERTGTKTVVIPALGHDYEEPEYIWTETDNGYSVSASTVCRNDPEHVFHETVDAVYTVTTPVSCEEDGAGVYTASFASDVFSTQTKEVTLEALGHDYQYRSFKWNGYTSAAAEFVCTHDPSHVETRTASVSSERTEPTCEETGKIVYTAAITEEDSLDGAAHSNTSTVTLAAKGHNYQTPQYEWTETEDGYTVTASSVCRNDSSHVVQETVNAAYEVTEPASCEGTGTGVYSAVFTGDAFSTQTKEVTLEATGHDYQFNTFIWTGNSQSGYSASSAEYICSHDSSHKQTKAAVLSAERTEPTCEQTGTIVYTAVLAEEDSIDGISRTDTKTVVLAAKGHSYQTPQYEWTETGSGYQIKATAVCRNDSSHVLQETVTASYRVSKSPTCEASGTGTYSAVFNNSQFSTQTKTVTIPAIGHDYGTPEYTWVKTSDGYSVTAKTICQNDSSHIVTETVNASFEMTDDPAQESKTGLYTAEFTNDLFETQTKVWTFVSGVELDQSNVVFSALDESVTLHATVLPAAADNKAVRWESSDESVATVDENGVVTVHKSGEAVISVITEDGGYKAECTVTIGILSTGITLDVTEKTLEKGEDLTLTATVLPEETMNKSVTWTSSNPEIAGVDETGIVTALKTGETVITAKTDDTGLTVECRIQVVTPVKGIRIKADSTEIIKGESLQMTAVFDPQDADNQNVTWSSSDESVAAVDETGLVTAIVCGTAVITAKAEDGGFLDDLEIEVINPAQNITLNQTELNLYVDETERLTAVLYPEDATNKDLVWTSSDESVATVDENGNVKALGHGTAVITVVTSDGKTGASCVVNVKVKVSSIAINGTDPEGTICLRVGDSVVIQTEILPAEALDEPLSFISGESRVAAVDENGVLTGVGEGFTDIYVNSGDVSAAVRVIVRDDPYGYNSVLKSNFDKAIAYIRSNGQYDTANDMYLILDKSSSGATTVSYGWTPQHPYYLIMSVNVQNSSTNNHKTNVVIDIQNSYVYVNTSGYISNSNGSLRYDLECPYIPSQEYDITNPPALTNKTYTGTGIYKTESTGKEYVNELLVNDWNLFDLYLETLVGFGVDGVGVGTALTDIRDTVYPQAVSAVFSDSLINMNTGEHRTLNVIFSPAGSYVNSLDWTVSDPSVITVTGGPTSASIEALKAGESTVTVVVNGEQLTCRIVVSDALSIDEDELLEVIDQFEDPKKLDVTVEGYGTEDLVFISGNPGIVTIDQDGYYTIHNPGTTTITVRTKDGKHEKTLTITVVRTVHAEGISLDQNSITVNKNTSVKLTPEITPANASNQMVVWTSANENIASVDEQGNVTGRANGTTVVTVTTEDGGYTAQCEVTVVTLVSEIVLSAEKLEIPLGETGTINAEVLPEDATNKNFTWSSSDPDVVSVDSDGTVHALTGGTAVITAAAEDNGITAECVVVSVVKAQGIRIIEQPETLELGESARILVAFEPENTTNQNVIWTSSDDSIVTVDEEGLVTAVGEGTVTITAESEDGGFTAEAEIVVHYTHVESISLPVEKVDLLAGETVTLEPVVLPENAVNKTVHYESQDTGIASVDENGVVTGVSQGKTVITVTTDDGSLTAECTVTVHPRAIYVKEIPAQRYTGSAIKPEIKVYDSGVLLALGKDYTVTYKNNIKTASGDDAKAPSAVIKMNKKGNYAGTKTITFTIEPVDLSEENAEITVDALSAQATGKTLTPVPTVYWNGKKLKNKTDFTVTYPGWDQITDGIYSAVVTGKGNFSGTRTVSLVVTPKGKVSVSKLKVTSKARQYLEMTGDFGKDILSRLTVKNGKTALTEGTDYEFVEGSESGCDRIGSCRFNIRGINDYEGEKTVTVKITGTSLTDKAVTVTNLTIYRYNGQPQKLSDQFGLKYNGNDIDPSNYEILEDTYKNNINAGTASVIVQGKNEFYGKRTIKFTILPVTTGFTGYDITIERAYYTKGGSKPKVTVRGLSEKDYTVKYLDNKAVGIGAVVITGKGDYKGLSISRSFRIEPKPISDTALTVKDVVFSSKAGKYRSTPSLKDTDGKALKAGVDYEKTYKYERVDENGNVVCELSQRDVVAAGGLVKVTVTAKGNNYTGTTSAVYRILQSGTDISKAKVTANAKEYTGKEVTLGGNDLIVRLGTTELVLGRDYEIVEDSYKKNINKGTASVIIRGINQYGGMKTVSFKIGARNIGNYWEGMKDFLSQLF